jgi:hypothetical protein
MQLPIGWEQLEPFLTISEEMGQKQVCVFLIFCSHVSHKIEAYKKFNDGALPRVIKINIKSVAKYCRVSVKTLESILRIAGEALADTPPITDELSMSVRWSTGGVLADDFQISYVPVFKGFLKTRKEKKIEGNIIKENITCSPSPAGLFSLDGLNVEEIKQLGIDFEKFEDAFGLNDMFEHIPSGLEFFHSDKCNAKDLNKFLWGHMNRNLAWEYEKLGAREPYEEKPYV